ncbi:MAG: MBL fold metallo-hydrolase [Alphaproteobacteria bacterium]|nr:MBL fold metallo-hydrolase [Alphaproteobacteria bacterium]
MVKQVPLDGIINTNAYFYIDEQSKHGFLIDPATNAEKLVNMIFQNGWTIEKMLITHGHFDHIGAAEKLGKIFNIPYFAHTKSAEYLTDGNMNLSGYFEQPIVLSEAKYLNEGDKIRLNANPQIELEVIHTPGHTQDAVIYYDSKQNIAFVGDTIFKNSIGATHFPGGNLKQLLQSIKTKILALPPQTILYSGHSEPTTIAAESKNFAKMHV